MGKNRWFYAELTTPFPKPQSQAAEAISRAAMRDSLRLWQKAKPHAFTRCGRNKMRRWNGWGDHNHLPTAEKAEPFLNAGVGESKTPTRYTQRKRVNTIPVSRLPMHPLCPPQPKNVLPRARQSLPD